MLDLSKIKNITIAEGSVTKITNSSGVVLWQKVVAPSASLDVDLNNQWIASTKTLDDYRVYMSNSNKGVNNGYASMKFKFKGMPNFKLWINSYAESNYDYTIAWNLDVDYPTSNPSNGSTGVKAHTRGNQKDPTSISNFTEVDYANDGGEHFVVVTYRKDSSFDSNDDRGYVAIKLTLISTTWVLSSNEFVKKDGKYYERINEVGTYEGGVIALTGNYKEGNELTVTYKQGSADDYILVGSKMYYKNYIYVTPKDQEIYTGDYIQGNYIGEATPSMKVTYTDNSEKTFYELTTIEQDTDPNKVNAKEVEIYDSVTSIGDWAFGIDEYNPIRYQSCRSLTSVTIPDSVTRIGAGAFNQCLSLTDITIPNSVTSIGDYSFSETKITSITKPNSLTTISRGAFENCSNLESVTLPEGLTIIGCYAFNACTNLASVTIENSTSKLAYEDLAFGNISSTAKLYVPSNLLSQYQSDSSWTGAFGGGIFAIPIPAMKVTYTDNSEKTFYNLTTIEENTVSNKVNAKEVEVYDGVTSIGDWAFLNCPSLTSVTIPNSVTSIGNAAFGYCSSLVTVTIENSTSKISYSNQAFADIASTTKLYVPSNLLSQYQSDSSWTGAFGGGIFAIPS